MKETYGVSIKWLSVTCFEIRCGNTTIVTDPYITPCKGTDLTWEAVEQCDMILVSHTHSDHVADIPALTEKFYPLILCPEQAGLPIAQWLNYTPSRIYPMYPGTELDFGDVKVKSIYGRHQEQNKGYCDKIANYDSRFPENIIPVYRAGCFAYSNYLLTLPNGTRILIWGNDPTVEQARQCKALQPDIAILQRSTPAHVIAKKAAFAAEIGCKVLIPHHQDTYGIDDPQILEAFGQQFLELAPNAVFVNPKHGEWLHL